MYYRTLVLLLLIFLVGCVSNKAVRTVQTGDNEKSCETLTAELTELGAKFEEAKDDSGVTGKNVGLAIVFWPGVIVNEVRANKNQDSIDARISHLTSLYDSKCRGSNQQDAEAGTLTERLQELKELHEQGLISDDEYQAARERALADL